jgi:hypothetical protein
MIFIYKEFVIKMCIICYKSVINEEEIECSYCDTLTEIPKDLVNLRKLRINSCRNLTTISKELTS